MKIFITGGTGFIGRHLIKALEGNQILALSRTLQPQGDSSELTWLLGDIDNPEHWVTELTQFKPDIFVHLAWSGLPDYSKEISEKNVHITSKLIASLKKTNLRKIVVAGSCWEYGNSVGRTSETHNSLVESDFVKAKVRVHNMFDEYCLSSGIDLIWARIFFSYGAGQRKSSLLPTVFTSIMNGELPEIKSPKSVQDFIHISDVVSALSRLVYKNDIAGTFNIGSGEPTSIVRFVNLIASIYGSEFRLNDEESNSGLWANIEKIGAITGWYPLVSIEDGIKQTVEQLMKSTHD